MSKSQQQQLRGTDIRLKLRQMEYADRTREAKYFDIRSGVLKQTRDSKLSPIYEPDPCVGAHKDDAFTLQGVNETVKCAKYLT